MGTKMRNKVKTMKMDDLEKIYYGPNKDGKNVSANEMRDYENYIRDRFISPMRENEVKQFFSPLGVVERISRTNQKKTSDFKIEDENLLIEATSINTVVVGEQDGYGNIPINLPANENKFIERIDKKIGHAEEKEDTPGYYKVVVICYDVVIFSLAKNSQIKKIFDPDFIRKTTFPSSPFDALMFLPPKAFPCYSAEFMENIGGDMETPKAICYVKGQKLAGLLSKIEDLELKLLGDKDETKI